MYMAYKKYFGVTSAPPPGKFMTTPLEMLEIVEV